MRTEAVGRQPSGLGTVLRRFVASLRRIAGMPGYEEYVRHLRTSHPVEPVPSEREFFEAFLKARHGNGVSRCC